MSDRYKGAILSPTAPTVTPQSAGGIYTTSQQFQYQGQGVWPTAVNYPINNSLRIRSSASAYLNRTPGSSGNAQKFTMSCWVKLGSTSQTSGQITFLNAGNGTQTNTTNDQIQLRTDGTALQVGCLGKGGSGGTYAQFTPYYRDPSAWYHIVVALDTTQATQADRCKAYVNGVQITNTVVNGFTQNYSFSYINNTVGHLIGRNNEGGGPVYTDAYFAEYHFIDGLQLTPSSFGTTDAYGIWQPIPYTGAYGTNGFYLPFTDNSALTTSSNVGLGKDFSGNGNYWVTNNISITAGSTYDSMTDVPTNTNSNTANYCVLNPLVISTIGGTKSNGNLLVTSNSSTYAYFAMPTMFVSSGKWYAEVVMQSGLGCIIGIVPQNPPFSGNYIGAAAGCGTGLYETGSMFNFDNAGSIQTGLSTFTTGTVVGVALDMDNDVMNIYINGTILATGRPNNNCVTYSLKAVSSNWGIAFGNNATYTTSINYGQQPFSYTPPTGFNRLNTYNLPTPTILAGNRYMDATTYSGNSSTQSITNSGSMQPDFVWLKNRSSATYHWLTNAITGTSKQLTSNATDAESSYTQILTAFNSNGFTVGTDGDVNANGSSYVGWQWKANGTGVSNTNGTITSTVSANTTAGFSIVTWTGTGVNNATVGHGLSVTPAMIIVKSRTQTYNWDIYHQSLGITATLTFTTSATRNVNAFGTNNPTSSVFSVYTNYTNDSGANYVAYCFSAVSGYSAFGSYTGNGSTSNDGPFVFLGFRPKFIMGKRSDSTGGWWMFDTSRSTFNLTDDYFYAQSSDAEFVDITTLNIDILSNGFKVRSGSSPSTWINASGGTYIYMAFAENPFKISRAR